MKGRISLFSLTVCLLLFSFSSVADLNEGAVESVSDCQVSNLNTGLNYTTIQNAIDANETLDGHTIKVCAGLYEEHIRVYKSLTLLGEDANTTIIDGSGVGTIVEISDQNVILSNFTLANGAIGAYIRDGASNSSLRFNNIMGTRMGIQMQGSGFHMPNNVTVAYNSVTNSICGVDLGPNAVNCTLMNNTLITNELGMEIGGEQNNVSGNLVEDNFLGIYLHGSSVLRENEMNRNRFNLVTLPSPLAHGSIMPLCDIDTSNKINGKSVYYLVNQTDMVFNSSMSTEVGFLGLKNCKNVTIEGLTMTENSHGIILEDCVECSVQDCFLQDNMVGILVNGMDVIIADTSVSGNCHGIMVTGSNITIDGNEVYNNTVRALPYRYPEEWPAPEIGSLNRWVEDLMWYSGGIWLIFADNCTVTDNNVSANEHGITLYGSSFGVFRNNTMADNIFNFGIDSERLIPPAWTSSPPVPREISPYLSHQIGPDNTVNGRPIYHWINQHNTMVPADAGYIVLVNCTNINISDATLSNNYQGILLAGANNTMITNNTITNTRVGIDISESYNCITSTNNTVQANTLTENGIGIMNRGGRNNMTGNYLASNLFSVVTFDFGDITENTILNNTRPLDDEWVLGWLPKNYNYFWWRVYGTGACDYESCFGGVVVVGACNRIMENWIEGNDFGLHLNNLQHINITKNDVSENCFINNIYGIWFFAEDNRFIHNNFLGNTYSAYIDPQHIPFPSPPALANVWDNGVEGNYWSDYIGIDADRDGIGDTNYTIPYIFSNTDNYSLMGLFSAFKATEDQRVETICNSTISGFRFTGTSICFNVSGTDDTAGFCRIRISTSLINETYTVFINGTEVPYELLPVSNSTYSYLYFSYEHSTQEVIIVPEFSQMLLTLFMFLATALIFLQRKRECGSTLH